MNTLKDLNMMRLEKFKFGEYDERYARRAMRKLLPGDNETWNYYKNGRINKRLSKVLYYGTKPIGIYILGTCTNLERFLLENEDVKLQRSIRKYRDRKGIHGIGLWIEPEYRSYGFGQLLIEYAQSHGDYVFGGHTVELNNIKHWLKRRDLIAKYYEVDNGRKRLSAYWTASEIKR